MYTDAKTPNTRFILDTISWQSWCFPISSFSHPCPFLRRLLPEFLPSSFPSVSFDTFTSWIWIWYLIWECCSYNHIYSESLIQIGKLWAIVETQFELPKDIFSNLDWDSEDHQTNWTFLSYFGLLSLDQPHPSKPLQLTKNSYLPKTEGILLLSVDWLKAGKSRYELCALRLFLFSS